MAQLRTLKVYTDGCCKGNPNIGGWGFVVTNGTSQRRLNGAVYLRNQEGAAIQSTTNRMELHAVVEALTYCNNIYRPGTTINICIDSNYVKSGITQWIENWKKNNWITSKKEEVKNQDLWQRLDAFTNAHVVVWHWMKAQDRELLVLADNLANEAVIEL